MRALAEDAKNEERLGKMLVFEENDQGLNVFKTPIWVPKMGGIRDLSWKSLIK